MDESNIANEEAGSEVIQSTPEIVDDEGPSLANPVRDKKTPQKLAIAIRRHFKTGKSRAEIMLIEGCTPKQYRYAVRLMGKFPHGNEEAFGKYNLAMQGHLEDVANALFYAVRQNDLVAIAALTKTAASIHDSILDMAMKLGVLFKAPNKVEVTERKRFDIGFGDESEVKKPMWPTGSEQVQ
jgi:hypothetical protein